MNLIGCKVKHKVYGIGTIIEQEDAEHISVEFASKASTFQYPLSGAPCGHSLLRAGHSLLLYES